ncbi:carboxylesterase [Clostridiales Family XIII bacterium PM5-7]
MNHREYVNDIKDGKTVVLFIHGIVGTPDHFDALIDMLPADIGVHNLLLPGHGGTPKDFAKSSMKEWKAYVFHRLETLFDKYENVYIVGHSMGTLFAIEAAIQRPDKIKGLFLMAIPLCPMPKASAAWNSLKVIFDRISDKDEVAQAAKESFSMEPDKNLLTYVTWVPRYLELIEEAVHVRRNIELLAVPGVAIQSKQDELVSNRATGYLQQCSALTIHVLEESKHFYYPEEDYRELLTIFREWARVIAQ